MSTQKRQKQYFEQRKRQQLEHNSSVIESYSYKKAPNTQCDGNNRSLDVLTLLNLSKNGQDCTSRLTEEERGCLNGEQTAPNYQTANCQNVIQTETKNLYPSEHVEIREKRIESNHLEDTAFPKNHPDASKRNNVKDPVKPTTEYKLSVVDMLNDDGENNTSRGTFVHENHVAFSVEGLGKVEMGTPVHSPQHPTRNLSYGYPAPPKVSKNLNCRLEDRFLKMDDMAFGVDLPTDSSSLEIPPYLEKQFHKSKHKTRIGKENLLHNSQDFLSNERYYDSKMEQDGFKWHEECNFLDDNYVDNDCGIYQKSWSCDLNSSMVNYMTSRNYDKPDFSFEGLHMQKRRTSTKTASYYNVSELSSPYKHQMDHHYDFTTSDITCYPTPRRNSDLSEMTHSSAWPSFATEDARDSLTFLREDSCLSGSVWHARTKNPLFHSSERQTGRHEADFRIPENNFITKKKTFSDDFSTKRMSEFSTQEDNWLYEEQYTKPDYSSINTSWTKEPFDPNFDSKFHVNEKPSASRSEHDAFSGNQESFNCLFKEEKDSSKMQFRESVSTGENKSVTVTLPTVSNSYSSSENGALDSEINHSNSEEEKVKTPEITPPLNTILSSPSRSEGGSSSVEMPHKQKESDGLKVCANATQSSLINQNEHKEIQKQRILEM